MWLGFAVLLAFMAAAHRILLKGLVGINMLGSICWDCSVFFVPLLRLLDLDDTVTGVPSSVKLCWLRGNGRKKSS